MIGATWGKLSLTSPVLTLSLNGNCASFTHIKVCLHVLGSTTAYVKKKKLYKAFCGSRGSCAKSDKLPEVT